MIDSIKKRALALLDKHVPEDIAIKGLSKISPEIGSFLKKGISAGLPIAGGLEFLRNQFLGNKSEVPSLRENARPEERAAHRQQQQSENQSNIIKQAGRLGLTAATGLAGANALGKAASAIGNAVSQETQPEKQISPLDEFSSTYPELFEFINQHIQKGRTTKEATGLAVLNSKFEKMIRKVEKDKGLNFEDYLEQILGQNPQQSNVPQQIQKENGNQALLSAIDKIMKL